MSPREILDIIAPPHDVGIPIRDARGVRRIVQKDLEGSLLLPRSAATYAAHKAQLVATMRHYDGGPTQTGAGYYANVFVAFRIGTATWRTGGVRILLPEAERIARALDRGTGTKPGQDEAERLVGTGSGNASQLRAMALGGGSVLLYVRFAGQGGAVFRSRGVEVLPEERAAVAEGLRAFARMRGRAK